MYPPMSGPTSGPAHKNAGSLSAPEEKTRMKNPPSKGLRLPRVCACIRQCRGLTHPPLQEIPLSNLDDRNTRACGFPRGCCQAVEGCDAPKSQTL